MSTIVVDERFRSDEIFNDVNKMFITLKDDETREYNEHLQNVLSTFIESMRENSLFEACFQRVAYVGSYYERLKVGKPEEFDLNFVIKLPFDYSALTTEIASEKPGYIKIKADPEVLKDLKKDREWRTYKIMNSWFNKKGYLCQNKFREWFELVATDAFESLDGYISHDGYDYTLHYENNGPAWTLQIDASDGAIIDIDLVPVLEFTNGPSKPFLKRNTKRKNWFAISKPLEGPNKNILWRPSFYKRELEMLKGSIKPVIRQLKKLRDTQNLKSIASYHIKTLCLWELNDQPQEFQRLPSTFLFFYMLKKLHEAFAKHEIRDFWNPKNNLLSNVSSGDMTRTKGRLGNIIKQVQRRIVDDPYVVAEYILNREELAELKDTRRLDQIRGYFMGLWNTF